MFSRLFSFFRTKREPDPTPQAAPEMACEAEIHPEPATDADSIDPSLDEYPDDYPRDWHIRKRQILERDNYVCQAPGCCGKDIDIHHKIPRSKGGSHRADNLVALCRIHHAIVHLDMNKIEVTSDRCSIVSAHWNAGNHVPLHVRRYRRITKPELDHIREYFGLKCRNCGSEKWEGRFRVWNHTIRIRCPGCNGRWKLEAGLKEETATLLAMAFQPQRNPRIFTFDPNLIRGISPPKFYEGCPQCVRENREGYLKVKFSIWGRYIGCSEWPRCPYVRPFRSS